MIDNVYEKLNSNEKLFYFESAANIAVQKLLQLEKESIEHEILTTYQIETETDIQFLRRLSVLKAKRDLIISFITLNTKVVNQHQQKEK